MNSCSFEIKDLPNVSIVEILKDTFKNDYERLIATMELAINSDGSNFNNHFINFYKEINNIENLPNFNTSDNNEAKKIAEAAIKYINKIDPRISNKIITDRDQTTIALYNYSDSAARDEGKRHVSNIILDNFKKVKFDAIPIEGNKIDYYMTKVKATVNGYIFKYINGKTGKKLSELNKEFKEAENKRDFIRNILITEDNNTISKNLYALWCELNIDKQHALDYINDLFNDPLLNKVLDDTKRDLDEINDQDNAESNQDLNETIETDVEDSITELDETFASYDHSGVKSSYNKHVSETIQLYFNTLPVLTSSDLNSYDRNNYFGIPTRMNASECSQFLYGINDQFDNITSMIEAIKLASQNIPKFKSFAILAKDLKLNHNLAKEMFSVFAKPKYDRIELNVTENTTTTKIANPRNNRRSALFLDFINSIKTTIESNDYDVMLDKYNSLAEKLTNLEPKIYSVSDTKKSKALESEYANSVLDDIENVIIDITNIFKSYFPNIEQSAIRAYIELANNASTDYKARYKNCITLASNIKKLIQEHKNSKQAYNTQKVNLARVEQHNNKLKLLRRKGKYVAQNKFLSDDEFRTDDYVNNHISNINQILDKIENYCVGNIRLNDRNIKGNMQSSILNSSWISGVKHMFDKFTKETINGKEVLKNDALLEWGKRKLLKTNQYKYSTVLLEQTDENGEVLNPNTAIFRLVNDTLQFTENADKILKIMFFQGASNIDEGLNVDYTGMTSENYLPTQYMMFFNTKDTFIKSLPIATYFTKTPSDAPNIFTVQSIRHSAKDLLILSQDEQNRVENDIKEIISNEIPLINGKEFIQKYVNSLSDEDRVNGRNEFTFIDDNELGNFLTKGKNIIITNAYSVHNSSPVEGSDTVYVSYMTERGITFALEGTLDKSTGTPTLKHSKVVGVANVNPKTKEKYDHVPDEIYNILRDRYYSRLEKYDIKSGDKIYKKIEYSINTESNVYKLIRNQFKQEILDGAIAINNYFELKQLDNSNYVIALNNGQPIIKKDITRGYKNYHIRGKRVFEMNKSKTRFNLTGDVFHSSNFTLNVIDENGNTYTKNYFEHLISQDTDIIKDDGLISFIYGGGMELICKDGKVTDIKFSKQQLSNIDKAMSDYLTEYIEQAIQEISDKKQFIKHTPTDRKSVAEFAINNLLMQFNFDALFDGSPKFYKSNQDVIKRVKQSQGSGNPYGSADYTSTFSPNVNKAEHSFLNDGYIEEIVTEKVRTKDGKIIVRPVLDENKKPKVNRTSVKDILGKYSVFEELEERNGFYAVTIENTKSTNNKALQELKKKLIKEIGISEEIADELLFGVLEEDENGEKVRTKGFQNTKVNDAQSYITVREFIRRLSAKGQLKRYLPLLERIMDESKPVSAKDVTEFIQVQKNFYFDIFYDENYGIEVVRQIKNAEFVLVPRFIKGTQLEAVYNSMIEAEIDQLNTVETSKAANEKVLKIWDNNGDVTDDILKTFVSEAKENKQIFSYNNLYTQQETVQHLDSQNKASLQIMKKMLDNIPSIGHPLSEFKNEFFEIYSTNIEEGCKELLNRLEIPLDENGKIKIEKGQIIGFNEKVLYNRLLEEARRTGVNDNQKDFFTFEEDSHYPIMPSFSNSYLSKFESVFQNMFNSAVTRQKLPGFHAAQITNIGFKPYAEGTKVSYAKELMYHPNQYKNKETNEIISEREFEALDKDNRKKYEDIGASPYIEVMVCYKALGIDKNSNHYKNMSDEDILKELQNKGLDEFIGYRIPTEGKQSVAIMKVVGFIDDALGSTIVVPNDWVSQTGSDFDIDSVYTITHEHMLDSNGEIFKIEYKSKKSDKPRTKYDWFNYLRRANIDVDFNASEEIKNRSNNFKKLQQKEIDNLREKETEIYNKLSNNVKKEIKKLNSAVDIALENSNNNKFDDYLFRLNYLSNMLKSNEKLNQLDEIKVFIDAVDKIYNKLNNKNNEYSEAHKAYIDEVLKEKEDIYNKEAKKNGLLTLEEYLDEKNDLIANSKKARNSRITDIFLNILRDPSTLEENLSRSNFDKITEAKNAKMNKNLKIERAGRNPHNVFDQIRYQEEVMSGRTLKGMSVALDTFCSICNTVRPTLSLPILVTYNSNEIDENIASLAFKISNSNKNEFTIEHNTYGWSVNDRNVEGYILTSYSSQTTAYILDAVKEGAIPNLNTYTFGVVKTLANLGIDYGTILSFIMQPGISEIVNRHNAKNSIFDKDYGNEINDTIIDICLRLNSEANENDSISTLLSGINEKFGKKISKIYGINDLKLGSRNSIIGKIPINVRILDERLQGTGRFKNVHGEDALLVDLCTALTYMRLSRIANTINSIARCCTSDKYGAKQTVYSTRKIIEDINKAIFTIENWDVDEENNEINIVKKERKPILTVDGKHILEAIFPGVAKENSTKDDIIDNIINNSNINDSKYPSIFAFLKYATATSSLVARTIFETQDPMFTSVVEGIGQSFSGANKNVTEQIYNDFQRYLLTAIYNEVPAIKYRVSVRKSDDDVEMKYTHTEDQSNPDIDNKVLAKEETSRIWGFNHDNDFNVTITDTASGKNSKYIKTVTFKDINDPTSDEMELYELLSPAQKVMFIQTHFNNSEIFGLITARLFNPKARKQWEGVQTLEFNDENTNPNEIFRMFKRAFESDNPIIVSAAIDLIKYSVQVEGFRMSMNAINKIIDNDALINTFNNGGIGFIDSIRQKMRSFGKISGFCGNAIEIQNVYQNYLRTFPANVPIRNLYLNKTNKTKYHITEQKYNILSISQSNESENPVENRRIFDKLLVKAGIKFNTISDEKYGVNQYIQITNPNEKSILYKIHDLGSIILLTPLTRLEPNENSQWSSKRSNNENYSTDIYLSPQAYDKLVNEYRLNLDDKFDLKFINDVINKFKSKTSDITDVFWIRNNAKTFRKADIGFNLEERINEGDSRAEKLKNDIVNHFSQITNAPLLVYNSLISDFIYTPGLEYGSFQSIKFPDNTVRTFEIFIPKAVNKFVERYLKPKKGKEVADTSEIDIPSLRTIIENAKESGDIRLSNLAQIREIDEAYFATIEDTYTNTEDEIYNSIIEDKIFDVIEFNSSLNNKNLPGSKLFDITSRFKNNLFANDITADVESIKANPVISMRETSSFIVRTASYIRNELFDKFIEDPDNINLYIPITDPRVQDIIASNAKYMDKYLNAILLAKELLDRSIPLTQETSKDKQIQYYIDDIKEAIAKNLQELPLDQLFHNAGNTILQTKSTNPLVKEGFLDVFDGYWKTYGSMWNFFSVMENGTPILQTILSDVMTDLDAKEKAKIKTLKRFRKGINDIIKRAEARGETVDIRKLISDDGILYALYTQKFLDDYESLRNEMSKYSQGSIEHLKAKLAFDEFKAKHINQDAVDSYYNTRNSIIRELLSKIPELYSEYMTLIYRRNAILDYANKEDLTDELKKELNEINLRIKSLYSDDFYIDENNELKPRPDIEKGQKYNKETIKFLKTRSNQAAKFLANKLEELSNLDKNTFGSQEDKGFRRTLESNLALMRRLERRDNNNIPTVPQSVLSQNPDYVKAATWIKDNAFFGLNIEFDKDKPLTISAKIAKAFNYFGRKVTGVSKLIEYSEDQKDIRGVVDGRKLSDAERLANKNHSNKNALTDDEHLDKGLINNAKPKNAIFSSAFYRQMSPTTGKKNAAYYRIVTEINDLLMPYLGSIDGYIHFERIPDNAKGIAIIKRVAELYEQLNKTNSRYGFSEEDSDTARLFIDKYVEFVVNEEEFRRQIKDISDKSNEFKNAMMSVFYVKDKNGKYKKDKDSGKLLPNRYLYSYAKPKGKPGEHNYDKFVNTEEQENRALLDKYYEKVTTEYYDYAKEEAIADGTYDEWFNANHYYNSYTRKVEPIDCWITHRIRSEYLTSNELEAKWFPRSSQKTRRAKTGKYKIVINGKEEILEKPNEKRNNDAYKPNEGNLANYKVGSGYDNDVELNQGEKEMLKYIKDTLMSTAKTNSIRRYFERGGVPLQAKSNLPVSKQILKELGKSIGIGLTENNGYSRFREEIEYGADESPMPSMLKALDNKVTVAFNEKLKNLQDNPPKKELNETDEEFANRVTKYQEAIKELKDKIKVERSAITNNNWYDVIENYLSQASDYNAVFENKNKLYFLLNILRDMKMYSRKYGSYGELKKQKVRDDGTAIYKTSVDKKLIEQYENFLRRLFYGEWKEQEGNLTKLGNFLQGFTSANYMMMNLRGGFANVTLGLTGIAAEAFAKDYIGGKHWKFGNKEYIKGISSYGAEAYNEAITGKRRALSKQGAVIDYFNVVDYDENTGVIRNANLEHYSETVRDLLFSPQSMGEHYMQNSVLFAILNSHKLFDTNQGVMAMNKSQYIAYKQFELLDEILTPEQRVNFEKFKNKLKQNKDELAKYAWFRSDALTKFMYIQCDDNQIQEFIKRRNKQQKELEKEFDSKQTVYEQLELANDGTLGFVTNSELYELDKKEANTLGKVTEAETILAKLSEKTRHVNNKIHGIYNKREAANIESKWYGGLIMQYHKHIPMGLLKRYMARGHWNEFRNSVDKGMVHSVIDFLSLNLEKVQKDCNFTKEESNALKSFMFQLTHCYKLLNQMAVTIKVIPEYERANMLRNMGDLLGTVGAIAATAALWAIADDDDPDGFWFNFFLYESDRLASESFMWNPYGMFNEGKKIMSTPVACYAVIEDAINIITGFVNWMTDDEFDFTYKSGRFAGENKLSVYIQRRIPIWSSIRNLIDITENNHYYKVGDNSISALNVKELVRD